MRPGEEDFLSKEDREAFHNQADRILDKTDSDYYVLEREDRPQSVRVVLAGLEGDETQLVYVRILPRHRFLVKGDDLRELTTRRDETVRFIDKIFS